MILYLSVRNYRSPNEDINTVRVVLDYGRTSPLLRSELSGIPLKYKSQSDWLKYLGMPFNGCH